jgi:hypothetical protein
LKGFVGEELETAIPREIGGLEHYLSIRVDRQVFFFFGIHALIELNYRFIS